MPHFQSSKVHVKAGQFETLILFHTPSNA